MEDMRRGPKSLMRMVRMVMMVRMVRMVSMVRMWDGAGGNGGSKSLMRPPSPHKGSCSTAIWWRGGDIRPQ